jgi:hypothetical protein
VGGLWGTLGVRWVDWTSCDCELFGGRRVASRLLASCRGRAKWRRGFAGIGGLWGKVFVPSFLALMSMIGRRYRRPVGCLKSDTFERPDTQCWEFENCTFHVPQNAQIRSHSKYSLTLPCQFATIQQSFRASHAKTNSRSHNFAPTPFFPPTTFSTPAASNSTSTASTNFSSSHLRPTTCRLIGASANLSGLYNS